MLVVLIGVSTWLQFVVVTDLSRQMLTFDGVWHFGERCSLPGWIPVFTVQGRWQTACMASCGWAVCWCQRCGSSGPWWRWGYGMGRRMLWTKNTGAFYWWHLDALDRRIRQRVPVPANIQQLRTAIEEEWTNIPQATINNLINSMRRRWQMVWLVFGPPPEPPPMHFRVAFYCGQPKAHLCNNHAVWSASWYATPVRWMDYLDKVLTNTDLDRFVNNISEK